MRKNAIYSPGDIGSLGTPRNGTTAPATQPTCIQREKIEPKVEFACLPLGGMIKAALREITHVDSVGPEPGVGYGLSRRYPGQQRKKNYLERVVESAACGASRSGRAPCS
jgi:hypothetical protein